MSPYYSEIIQQVIADKELAYKIMADMHKAWVEKEEKARNRNINPVRLSLHQPVYIKVHTFDSNISKKLQPTWKGPFFVSRFLGNTSIRVSKQLGGDELHTTLHRSYVKPYTARLIQPDDTPILQRQEINTRDWVTLGLTDKGKTEESTSIDKTNESENTDTNDKYDHNRETGQEVEDELHDSLEEISESDTVKNTGQLKPSTLPKSKRYAGHGLELLYDSIDPIHPEHWVPLSTLPTNHPHRKVIEDLPGLIGFLKSLKRKIHIYISHFPPYPNLILPHS